MRTTNKRAFVGFKGYKKKNREITLETETCRFKKIPKQNCKICMEMKK